MSDTSGLDPFGLARDWAARWEKLVNENGTDWLARPEAAQAMQALTGAAVRAQAASNEATGKLLAAANLPSRADVEALGTRIAAIEATLGRIESRLHEIGPPPQAPRRPTVRRTRKPPA